MGINIRTKGQSGERQVQKILNDIIVEVRKDLGLPAYEVIDLPFQRNQNQSAVGGADLSNPFGIEIEIKRQEALSINTWWKQCVISAARTDGIAILIFRQSRQKWRIIMKGIISCGPPGSSHFVRTRVEITLVSFKEWFEAYYREWLKNA